MACRWSRSLSCLKLPACALLQMPQTMIGGRGQRLRLRLHLHAWPSHALVCQVLNLRWNELCNPMISCQLKSAAHDIECEVFWGGGLLEYPMNSKREIFKWMPLPAESIKDGICWIKEYTKIWPHTNSCSENGLSTIKSAHAMWLSPTLLIWHVDSYAYYYYYYTECYNKRWKDNQKQALEYSDMTAHSERSFHASAMVGFQWLSHSPSRSILLIPFPHTLDMYPGISEVAFHEVLVNIEYITLCRCRSGVLLYGETP